MASSAMAALQVEQPPSLSQPVAAGGAAAAVADAPVRRSRRHDTFPSWFRMSAKMAALVMIITLPALAMRDPSLAISERASPKFSILFMLLGLLTLPLWVPHVGNLVITFTVLIPVCYFSIWASYGAFHAFPNAYFLQIGIIVVTFVFFFLGEIVSLPRALTGIMITLYVATVGNFLAMPRMAFTLALVLTVALALAAALVITVFSTVFPEYCTDLVWQCHHEALEHLLHAAHHVLNSKPPRLLERGKTSEARRYGSGNTDRRALMGLADNPGAVDDAAQRAEVPRGEASSGDFLALEEDRPGGGDSDSESGSDDEGLKLPARGPAGRRGLLARRARRAAGVAPLTTLQRAERAYRRMMVCLNNGSKAQGGARAELVLGFCGSTRPIIPWFPLLPSGRCRPDPGILTNVRIEAVSTALALYKLHAAIAQVGPKTRPLLKGVRTPGGADWVSVRSHLLGCLQEIVDVFPQDYYPPPRPISAAHAEALADHVAQLRGLWAGRIAEGSSGEGEGGVSATVRLQAALLLQQLSDASGELLRLHHAVAQAMDGLNAATYGFLGFPCCTPSA
ncbi:MAG: hypothetical protein J3K34DRAFT_415617 [Monoraphidium minutum]|nr:MAG: hypothetical protein J3K34DRAFT_415617 [Monoraphidium minutum]